MGDIDGEVEGSGPGASAKVRVCCSIRPMGVYITHRFRVTL